MVSGDEDSLNSAYVTDEDCLASGYVTGEDCLASGYVTGEDCLVSAYVTGEDCECSRVLASLVVVFKSISIPTDPTNVSQISVSD